MPDTTTRPWNCPQVDCPASTHDDYGPYTHGCRSGAALAAKARYDKRWTAKANVSRFVDAGEVRRLLQAAHYVGWSGQDIADRTGGSRRHLNLICQGRVPNVLVSTRDQLVPLLRKLAATTPPETRAASLARAWARRSGFEPLTARVAWVNALGVRRRIEAAYFMGWVAEDIGGQVQCSRHYVGLLLQERQPHVRYAHDDGFIVELERLAMRGAPAGASASKAKARARREGFRPLLAWDDIDDPAEQAPPPPDLTDQIAELAGRGLNQTQVAKKLDVSEKTVRNRWPEVPVSVDVNIVDAVRTGRRHLSECSDPEAEAVVEAVFRDYRGEGWEKPGAKTAELLEVDYAVVQTIRNRLAARNRRPVKEKP